MMLPESELDAAVFELLCECVEIQPPLTKTEIVQLFVDRINMEAPEMVLGALQRLVSKERISLRGRGYQLAVEADAA